MTIFDHFWMFFTVYASDAWRQPCITSVVGSVGGSRGSSLAYNLRFVYTNAMLANARDSISHTDKGLTPDSSVSDLGTEPQATYLCTTNTRNLSGVP